MLCFWCADLVIKINYRNCLTYSDGEGKGLIFRTLGFLVYFGLFDGFCWIFGRDWMVYLFYLVFFGFIFGFLGFGDFWVFCVFLGFNVLFLVSGALF